jgi:hypothetical protein
MRTVKRFAYAFVAVPTGNIHVLTPQVMPVLRVKNLSGGNFWGQPAKKGVAGSLADIFNKNFLSATQHLGRPWRNHLDDELRSLRSKYKYFDY